MISLRLYSPGEQRERWSLSSFAAEWLFPRLRSAPSTMELMRDALQWWQRLTNDPPLETIDEPLLNRFAADLANATYTRGRFGRPLPLAPATVAKHLAAIDRMLQAAGPRRSRRQPAAEILERVPMMPLERLDPDPKPVFAIAEARALYAAAETFDRTRRPHARAARPDLLPHYLPHRAAVCRRFLGLLFYTGQRSGTILQLTAAHITTAERCGMDGGAAPWLSIPKALVPKTKKPTLRPIHPRLALALAEGPPLSPDVPLVPFPYSYSHLCDLHRDAQRAAGMSEPLTIHAWRRTFARSLQRAGLDRSIRLASAGLDHSDTSTSLDFYLDDMAAMVGALIPLLPDLVS